MYVVLQNLLVLDAFWSLPVALWTKYIKLRTKFWMKEVNFFSSKCTVLQQTSTAKLAELFQKF